MREARHEAAGGSGAGLAGLAARRAVHPGVRVAGADRRRPEVGLHVADADADASADLDPTAAAGQLRRRRTVAALVACTITFGTGHAAAGAWLRFMLLAGLEALGLRYLAGGAVGLGASLVVGAVALDIVGSQLELGGQARRARTLPRAQVRKRTPDGRPAPRQ